MNKFFLASIIAIFAHTYAFAQDLSETESYLRNTLEIQLKQNDDLKQWLVDKHNLEAEIIAASQIKKNLLAEIEKLNQELKSSSVDVEAEIAAQKETEEKYLKIQTELSQALENLTLLKPGVAPCKEAELLIDSVVESKTLNSNQNLAYVFDQILNVHQQIWQLSQSFQINEATIQIKDKKYHGQLIRLGLVYHFFLLTDQKKWAYYDSKINSWSFGPGKETAHLQKIYDILSKKSAPELARIPEVQK